MGGSRARGAISLICGTLLLLGMGSDAGFAAENLHLQAVAHGLGTVVMGAFNDDEVHRVMQLNPDEQPMLILPIGWPKG